LAKESSQAFAYSSKEELNRGNKEALMPMTATTYEALPNRTYLKSHPKAKVHSMDWIAPIGRFLFSLMFIVAGFNHFASQTIEMAASQGVPMANILVPFSGAMAAVGGLMILLGYRARYGALLIILFLIPVTLMMHNFWTPTDPAQIQMQMAHFMKNVSMLGGSIMIAYFGSGAMSLDNSNHH
jgi:putative oxidoreductase